MKMVIAFKAYKIFRRPATWLAKCSPPLGFSPRVLFSSQHPYQLVSKPKFLIKMFQRRSKDEDSEYPFFEGDGSSSDEWRDYGMSGEDYEGPPVFDDDQYKEELMPVYDTAIEDVIEEE
nr:hypothetical protein [Tanacetum cinerariifolium]